ncbi:antitoxin Xre/MbcA/ParS toxin-binding domain-containing protein [Thermithiobacillus plumbiphilus]|uniref:Antitoxin Xre/MbcA/ParS toxin-binding domain-containing protein n=1 Tax=Thermithiobacillus plumbiphilus TaxID=1729899 RepID=A0ABU9D520_9PROT
MISVSAEHIAIVMSLSPLPHSFSELDEMVRNGLPKSALRTSVDHLARTKEERRTLLYRLVPEATYKRRRDRLSPEESEKTERLARVYATAEQVWDSGEDAREFLNTPHPLLHGMTPLEVSMSELGARRVEELLWKLFYGMPV